MALRLSLFATKATNLRLRRLSNKDPESLKILDLCINLIKSKELNLNIEIETIDRIELIDINADVKNTTWAIGLNISGSTTDRKDFDKRIFVKQTSSQMFKAELKANNLLKSNRLGHDPIISSPFQLINEHKLIISELIEGTNAKYSLRKCLSNPIARKLKSKTIENYFNYGQWLAYFHRNGTKKEIADLENYKNATMDGLLFTTEASVVDEISSEQLIAEIRQYLEVTPNHSDIGYVHGDFGPQNIMIKTQGFSVVDWELFHLGHHIEDCIHFLINVLTQVKHVPFEFGFTQKLITSFLRGYQSEQLCFNCFENVVTLLAISNIFKRQEWMAADFPAYQRLNYIPLLRDIANNNYQQWKLNSS